MEKQNSRGKITICKKCREVIVYSDDDTYWNCSGYGYDVKLVKCSHCKTPNVLEYIDDKWLSE